MELQEELAASATTDEFAPEQPAAATMKVAALSASAHCARLSQNI
jgi:hypothetical protein